MGARHHYAIPRMLERAGMLEALYTDSCAVRGLGRWLTKLIPRCLHRGPIGGLAQRQVVGVPKGKIRVVDQLLWHSLKRITRGRRESDTLAGMDRVFGQALLR